jgi:hypothetical protein
LQIIVFTLYDQRVCGCKDKIKCKLQVYFNIKQKKKMALANYIRDIQGRKKEFYLKTLIDPKATKECLKSWFHR